MSHFTGRLRLFHGEFWAGLVNPVISDYDVSVFLVQTCGRPRCDVCRQGTTTEPAALMSLPDL